MRKIALMASLFMLFLLMLGCDTNQQVAPGIPINNMPSGTNLKEFESLQNCIVNFMERYVACSQYSIDVDYLKVINSSSKAMCQRQHHFRIYRPLEAEDLA